MSIAKRVAVQFCGTALLFSATVAFGTSLTLLVASSIGYLPYSDRPGPGWWGRVHWPSLVEAENYLGFAPLFGYFCLFFGVGLFLLSLTLGFASSPNWLNRIIGGIISALAAGFAVAGAGWYIALAQLGPDVAIVLGLIYGVFLFPRFIFMHEHHLPVWLRVGVIFVASAAFTFWIVSPLLPRKTIPQINFQLNRITPGSQVYSTVTEQFLGAGVAKEVTDLGIVGEVHGGIGGSGGGRGVLIDSTHPVSILLIALEPIDREFKLRLPQSGYVVYVLKDHQWKAHPAFSETDGRKLIVKPGIDSKYEGGQIKIGDDKSFSSFTWYPVVPR